MERELRRIRAETDRSKKYGDIYILLKGDTSEYEMTNIEKEIFDIINEVRLEEDPRIQREMIDQLIEVIGNGQYVLKYNIDGIDKTVFLNRTTCERLFRFFLSEQPVNQFNEINMGEYMNDLFEGNAKLIVVMDLGKYEPPSHVNITKTNDILEGLEKLIDGDDNRVRIEILSILESKIGLSTYAVHYDINGIHKVFYLNNDSLMSMYDAADGIDVSDQSIKDILSGAATIISVTRVGKDEVYGKRKKKNKKTKKKRIIRRSPRTTNIILTRAGPGTISRADISRMLTSNRSRSISPSSASESAPDNTAAGNRLYRSRDTSPVINLSNTNLRRQTTNKSPLSRQSPSSRVIKGKSSKVAKTKREEISVIAADDRFAGTYNLITRRGTLDLDIEINSNATNYGRIR